MVTTTLTFHQANVFGQFLYRHSKQITLLYLYVLLLDTDTHIIIIDFLLLLHTQRHIIITDRHILL